ncbi:MAG: pyridoxal-5'-phosphate-dependent protein [Rhodospirillaceae bacterium]|nr:pyridoxal-5'-phosphate-dependent protein [Rhodospirillaceae bacterium]
MTTEQTASGTLVAPTFDDVVAAARRLRGQAVVTPLLRSDAIDAACGGRLFFKPEVLQRTGSFKFRGAFNRISQLSEDERKRGVVAYSSGNHAQGVAAAACQLGAPALIVMPEDAPRAKLEGTRNLGADVVTYDRYTQSREAIAESIAAERGAIIVPPFDHPAVIAGQGTAGLEAANQCAALGVEPSVALVPCGGGGLIAGVATALTARLPGIQVYAVEPAGFDDTTRSLAAGERQENDPGARSVCDALLAPKPGDLTFSINRRLLAGGAVVDETEVATAMTAAFRHLKLVVEPGGAVALAAALAGKVDLAGRTALIVLSGGNVDTETYRRMLG